MPRNRPRPYGCKSQEVYWVNTGTCGHKVFRRTLRTCRLEGRLFIGKSKKQVYRSKSVVIGMRQGHEWFPLSAWVSAKVILFLSYRYPVLQSTCFVDVLSYRYPALQSSYLIDILLSQAHGMFLREQAGC